MNILLSCAFTDMDVWTDHVMTQLDSVEVEEQDLRRRNILSAKIHGGRKSPAIFQVMHYYLYFVARHSHHSPCHRGETLA